MTLDQIAKDMGLDQKTLSRHRWQSIATGTFMRLKRREFVHRAFTAGHTPEAIGEYIDRSQTMVTHALRMIAVNELHAEYGQTLAELRFRLTGDGA